MVEVLVTPVNDLPTVEGQQLTGQEDEAINIILLAEDLDQDELVYQIVDSPFYGQLSGEGANWIYTPDQDYSGPDRFTFKVSDGTEESLLAEVKFELEAIFDPPVFTTSADSLSGEYKTGEPINLLVSVENPEKTDLSYQLTGLPETAKAKLGTAKDGTRFSWLPTSEFAGTYSVTIAAMAADNPPVNLTFELVIVQVNRSPILQDSPAQLVAADELLSLTITAEDPDTDDQVEFVVERLGSKGSLPTLGPVQISSDEQKGTLATTVLEWTPDENDRGELVKFRIRATDAEGAESQMTLSIGVGDVNTPPQLTIETGDRYNVLETPAQGAAEGTEGLLITFSATDLQEDTLELSVLGLPKGAVFITDQETNSGQVTWLPDQRAGDGAEGFQIYTFQLVAEEIHADEKEPLQVKKPVRIRVQNLNLLPQLSTIDDLEIQEGEMLSFPFSATDEDQDKISFDSRGLPLGAKVTDNGDGSGQFEWEVPFGFASSGPVTVTIMAQDADGQLKDGINSQSFQITVISVNRPPEQVGQLPKLRVSEDELVEFGIEFIDPDSEINPLESFELSLRSPVEEAELIVIEEGKAVVRWQTDGNSGQDQAYEFEIVATDAAGAEASIVVIVIVDNINRPPEFSEFQIPSVLEGETVAVPLLAIDPDDPEEILSFQVGGDFPSGMAIIAGGELLIQPQIGQAGEYNLKLTVVDSEGAKARIKDQLTVTAQNLPPEIQPLQPIYNGVAGDLTPITITLLFSDPNEDLLDVTVEGDLPVGYQLDKENGSFSWQPTADQFGDYQLVFTISEIDTQEAYQTTVSTQISVLNPEGPILRDLQIIGTSGYVTLSVELEVKGDSLADVAFKIGTKEIYQQSEISSGQVSYDWDTSALGLGEESQYKITAEAKVGPNINQISIGPVPIDNKSPEISFTAAAVEAGTGELLDLEVKVVDNGELELVAFVFGTQLIKANSASDDNYQAKFVVPTNPIAELRAAGIDFTEVDGIIEFPFFIQATDLGGNTTLYPEGGSLTARLLDKTLPVAEIDQNKVIVKQGDIVRLSADQSTDNSGLISNYSWDLDDSDGVDFDASQYKSKYLEFTADRSSILTLRVKDVAGNEATAKTEIEVIDKTPPEPPVFGRVEFEGRQVKVEGQAEAGSTLILIFVAEAGGSREEWQTEVDENGFFSVSGSIVAEGLYRLQATAIDQAENVSRPTTSPNDVLIDLTAPDLFVGLGQADGLNETNNVRPPITVEIFDTGGIGPTQMSLLEGSTAVSIEGGSQRDGQGQNNLLLTVIPLRDLIDGVGYTVKVVSEDVVGNETEVDYQFKINLAIADTSPPQIRILSPRTDGMLIGYRRPRLKASIQDLGGFDLSANPVSVNLSTAGQEVALKGVSLKGDTNEILLTAFPAEELQPAEYVLSIQAQDQNGNQQSGDRTFIVIGPPMTTPVAGSLNRAQIDTEEQWLSTSSTTITGELDLSLFPGGGSVEVYRNDQLQVVATIDSNTGVFMTKLPLLEGKNQIDILPVNIVGLKGQFTPMGIFVVDTQKPIIESLQPSNGTALPNFSALRAVIKDSTIVSEIASGVNPDSISLTIDGQMVTDFSYDPTSGLLIYQPIASQNEAKEYTVLLKVSDLLGNSSQAEVKFQVDPDEDDVVPPTIAGLFPRLGQTINTQQLNGLEIRTSIYDVGSGLNTVQIRLDGQLVNLPTEETDDSLAGQGVIVIKPDQLSEGDHLLTIYAQDKSGNEKVVNSNFVVDTKADTPSIQTPSPFVNQTSISLNGQGEAGAAINLFINGQPTQSVEVNPKGNFIFDSVNLIEGNNEIYLESIDVAGNQSLRSTTASVFVDLQPPTVGNPIPSDGQRTQSQLLEMKVEVADNPGGSGIDTDSLQFVLDGNQPLWEFVYQSEIGLLSYIPAENSAEVLSLAEGLHTFRVVASDLAGNQTIFDSGQFYVDITPPEIGDLLPLEGDTLTSPAVKIQALIKAKDVAPDQISVKLKQLELDNLMELKANFDPISGKLVAQVENDLPSGDYVVSVSVADIAGNISQQQVNFKLDLTATDSQPPIIRPLFPLPNQEISTVSMMAIKFEVLDADSLINFEDMTVEINGVIYDNLFKKGSGNRYNRDTGEVILFGRLQLELGGLEDALELGGLEDALELGGLEDELELGVLDKPLDLSLGTNLISISVSDEFQNLTPFEFSFDVSLIPAASPTYDLVPPQPAAISDLMLSNIYQQEAQVTAGQTFTFNFEAKQNVVAAFMDLSQLDDSIMATQIKGQPINNNLELDLTTIVNEVEIDFELLQPSLDLKSLQSLLDQLAVENDAPITIERANLQRVPLYRTLTTPLDVRYGSNRFQAKGQISAETQIRGGEKSLALLVISQDLSAAVPLLELDLEELKVEFSNPATDQQRRSSRRRSRRSRQTNRLQLSADNDPQPIDGEETTDRNLAVVVTEYQGVVYTNATDIPLSGQISDLEEGRQVEVEVFVNGNSMGNVPVDNQGRFNLDKLVLDAGMNTVTSFSRTSSQLQSPASAPLQVFVDRQKPQVSFVDLPTHLSQTVTKITLDFLDDSQAPAQAMTLFVNGQPQPISLDQSTVQVAIQLQDGENRLALSAVDLVGNVSQLQERQLIVDSSPPGTAPSQLTAVLNTAGNQLELRWQADNNAGSYQLYRSSQPITEVGNLQPIAQNLADTIFVDSEVDLAQTYYYAVTSLSPAGVESLIVSDNLNLTIISAQGGTATAGDGSRITFGLAAISVDSTLRLAVSVETEPTSEQNLPSLAQDQTLANGDRQFKAISQSGLPFDEILSQMATVTIPYPAGETAESIRVYALVGGSWQQVQGVEINKNQQTLQFKTDRLTRFRLAVPQSQPWDPNNDGRVNIFDLVTVANDFGKSIYDQLNSVGNSYGQTGSSLASDLNGDGKVDILDLVAMGKQTFQDSIYTDLGQFGNEFGQKGGLMSNDINGDGEVDIFDLVLSARKSKPKLLGDINEDGYVDVFDLALVAIHFGEQYQLDQPASAPALVQGPAQGWVALNYPEMDNSSTFNVSLAAQLTQSLKGYQFTLSYDPALLSVMQIEEDDAFDGAGFSFEPPDCKPGEAKFAAVDLDRSEMTINRIGQEMVLANLLVQVYGKREEALSSLRLEEVILSNREGGRITVLYQHDQPKENNQHFALAQNFPNPFNPETWIPYYLSVDSQVEISIYNSTGKIVRRLEVGWQTAGEYQSRDQAAYWDGRNKLGEPVASGVYFYTIKAGEFSDTLKMLLMK